MLMKLMYIISSNKEPNLRNLNYRERYDIYYFPQGGPETIA